VLLWHPVPSFPFPFEYYIFLLVIKQLYLKINEIYGIVKKENIASWKILEKNGFLLLEEGIYNNYFQGKYLTRIYVK
jgi:RimJ/RimL family protein N-acetyltransferase